MTKKRFQIFSPAGHLVKEADILDAIPAVQVRAIFSRNYIDGKFSVFCMQKFCTCRRLSPPCLNKKKDKEVTTPTFSSRYLNNNKKIHRE